MTTVSETCRVCRFVFRGVQKMDDTEHERFACHRYPPSIFPIFAYAEREAVRPDGSKQKGLIPEPMGNQVAFPEVQPGWKCGEFRLAKRTA